MREALRQVKPTEFEDLIALVALYRPGPMAVHPHVRGAQARSRERLVPRRAAKPITGPTYGIASTRSSTWRSPSSSPASARRGGRSPQGDRQEDPRADGVAEAEVPRRLRRQQHHARPPKAVGRHREGAGLLVQQVPCRLLRADRLPDRVVAREPSAPVHGGADLLGHEHEGPRAVLRQRLRRDGHRGAAARRQRVGDRFRRRRRQDPLRAQRRQERRRRRRSGDHRAPVPRVEHSRRSGTSPSASTRRSSTSGPSSR